VTESGTGYRSRAVREAYQIIIVCDAGCNK